MNDHFASRENRTCLVARAAAFVAITSFALPAPAARADEKAACVASYERAQVRRHERKMQRAREELRSCSRAICPALVRSDCVTWLEQVEAAYPSIVIRAEKDGVDVATVHVVADNEVIATKLDGNAIEIEPGEHVFRFETDGAPPVTMTIVAREGEKNRVLPVRFASPHGAAGNDVHPATRPVPLGVYFLAGVGLAGLAGFGLLGAIGKRDESALRSSCSPNCSQQDIDTVRVKYIGADVSLGVGAAALGVAAVWYLLRPSQTEASQPAGGVAIVPQRGGAVFGWTRAF